MKICAAYIRVSTDDQLEYSPESQKDLIRDYAKKHDMILPDAHIYQDEGISGRTAEKRPGFQMMIGAAKEKPRPFDTILVWKFSRFARNQEESILYKAMLQKECGVDVISVSEPLIEGPFGSLIERIIEWMDEYYSIRLSGEVKRGMLKRVHAGKPVATAPFGYDISEGQLVMNPAEADLVKMIYRDFLAGCSILSIAAKLNGMQIKTKRGSTWENRTVRYILANPVYTGKLRWSQSGKNDYHKSHSHREDTLLIDGEHDAIIAPETYQKSMERLSQQVYAAAKYQRQEQGKKPFILQGLMKCSTCGGTMTHSGSGLNCSKYVHGKCSKSCYIEEKTIEYLVTAAIKDQMTSLNFTVENRSGVAANDNKILQKQIEKENNIMRRVREAYENGVDTLEEYRENKSKCKARIDTLAAQLKKEIKPINKKEYAKKRLADIKKVLDPNIPAKEKNQILKTFVEKIVYDKENESIAIYYFG